MKKVELKPCPFCGNREIASRTIKGYSNNDVGIVFCGICGAQIRYFRSEEKAIEAWNRRADDGKMHRM